MPENDVIELSSDDDDNAAPPEAAAIQPTPDAAVAPSADAKPDTVKSEPDEAVKEPLAAAPDTATPAPAHSALQMSRAVPNPNIAADTAPAAKNEPTQSNLANGATSAQVVAGPTPAAKIEDQHKPDPSIVPAATVLNQQPSDTALSGQPKMAPKVLPARNRAPPDHFEAGPAPSYAARGSIPNFGQPRSPRARAVNTNRFGPEPGFDKGALAAVNYADLGEESGFAGVQEAIVLRPTAEEFKSMFDYLNSDVVQEAGRKTGIIKIVPPAEWTAPSSPADRMLPGVPMSTRKQEVHKLTNSLGWKTEDYFDSLEQYREQAQQFKSDYFHGAPEASVTPAQVEKEYWQAVSGERGSVIVHYAADLDHSSVIPDPGLKVDNVEDLQAMWSLHSLAGLPGSFLQHLPQHISGVSVPWTYFGMMFSTFCWHNEDLWFPSINFLYEGETKVWYGVPGDHAETVKQVIETHKAGRLSLTKVFGLHNLLPPSRLLAAKVPVYRTEQKAGEFIVTFPAAYHAGFSCGWNCAEAVNFAQDSWLPMGRDYETIKRGKAPCLSIDELVIRTAHSFHSRQVEHQVKQLFSDKTDELEFAEKLDPKEKMLLECIQPELNNMRDRMQTQLKQLEHVYSAKLRRTCAVQQLPMSDTQRRRLVNAFGCVKCDRLCFMFLVQCKCVEDKLKARRTKEKNNIDLQTQEPYLCIECAMSDSDACGCDASDKTLFMRASPTQVEAVLQDGALWLTQQADQSTDERPAKAARCC